MLPEKLRARAIDHARKAGVSLGELVREALAARLDRSLATGPDPFLADRAVFRGPGPADLAADHDRYLYGE